MKGGPGRDVLGMLARLRQQIAPADVPSGPQLPEGPAFWLYAAQFLAIHAEVVAREDWPPPLHEHRRVVLEAFRDHLTDESRAFVLADLEKQSGERRQCSALGPENARARDAIECEMIAALRREPAAVGGAL